MTASWRCQVAAVLALALLSGLLSLAALPPASASAQETPESTATVVAQPTGDAGPADAPGPSDGGAQSGGFSWLDPRQWAGDLFNQVLTNLLQGLNDGLRAAVQQALGGSANVISQTPPALSYDSATVQALRSPVQAAANAALVLVAMWGGLNLVLRQHLGSVYHEAMELFPRLALGALLVNTSAWWTRLLIDANNGLCQLIGQATPPAWDRVDGATQALVSVLATLVYLVMALLLVLQMLVRLALVDVLLIVAPLGLLCWVLPQTQGWARLWSSTFARSVFTQFVQVVALKLGASLLTELQPGGPLAASGLLANVLGIAALLLVLKIPGLIGGQGGGFGFVQYVAYRHGVSALGAGVSRAGGPTRAAAAVKGA